MRELTGLDMDTTTHVECTPRPLAEQLAPQLAIAAVRQYETRRMPPGLFRSAWNHVEYAVNECDEYEDRRLYFETASALLGSIVTRDDSPEDIRLGALTLGSYLPSFMKRATGEVITPDDCASIYSSLGAALRYMRPLEIDEPPQWRMAEVAVLCLSARTNKPELLLYPASPREEQSPHQPLNHDSYFYTGVDKLPIQQKLLPTQKVYDDCITILTLDPIVEKASKVARLTIEDSLSTRVNYLLSLVIADATGSRLERDEKRFLDFMTEAVAAHHADLTTQLRTRRSA